VRNAVAEAIRAILLACRLCKRYAERVSRTHLKERMRRCSFLKAVASVMPARRHAAPSHHVAARKSSWFNSWFAAFKMRLRSVGSPRFQHWVAVFLLATAALGSAAPLRLKQLDHTAWTGKDGAPIAIFAIAQDLNGKLWLGSESGLYQFDGVHFTVFRPGPNEPELPFIVVSALSISTDGTVWVGGLQGGIAAIRDGHVSVYGAKEGLPASGGIAEILQAPDGTTWTVARNHLLRFSHGRWIEDSWNGSAPREDIDEVLIDESGTQWVEAGGTIYSRQSVSEPFELRGKGSEFGNTFVASMDGSLWDIESQHLTLPARIVERLTGSLTGRALGRSGQTSATRISQADQTAVFDRDGFLWIANDHGIFRYPPDQWPKDKSDQSSAAETYGHIDGLTADSIIALFRDREGNIWVGTSRGLDRFKTPALVRYLDVPLTGEASLASCANGDVWIASRDSPLVSIRDGNTVPHGYARWISSLYCDRDGAVWFGEQGGVWNYSNDQFRFTPFPDGFPTLAARQMSGDESRLFVAIRRSGVWLLSNGAWSKFSNPSFPDETAYSVLEDSRGRLWVGYSAGKIALLENGSGRSFKVGEGTGLGIVQIIKETRVGLIAGGTNGLAIFRGDAFQILQTADADAAQGVSGLIETSAGDLWINGSHGIFRIPSKEVEAALRLPGYRMRSESILLDGGPVNPANQGGYASTLVADTEGKLWFANTDQVASFDARSQSAEATPSDVEITSVVGDGVARQLQKPLLLSGVHALHIGYLAVDLTSPERLSYRYKLDGEDKDWQYAETRTDAAYTGLTPGTYTFHAAASNDGNIWREVTVPLTIKVLPAFYETSWFRLLCFLMASALVWLLVHLRLRYLSARIRERSEERANERVQIARDLHDTLLQGIQGLMLRFHFAAEKVPEGAEVRDMLNVALSTADRILQEGRERVKHLRDSNLSDVDLMDSLEMVGKELNWTNDTVLSVRIEGAARTLQPVVKEELFCIGREALTNAFRHAQASRIEISIDYGRRELRLCCSDDGCGMEPEVLAQGLSGHWGLLGMRERARKIGANLEACSVQGEGTEVAVALTARRAYSGRQSGRWFRWLSGFRPGQG
jgi:signal transduction histidine kinase/ligand-binding sensor domain-containing protein